MTAASGTTRSSATSSASAVTTLNANSARNAFTNALANTGHGPTSAGAAETVPFTQVTNLARFLRAPIISGIIVMLTIIQIANVALPNWIGLPSSPGFPLANIITGAVAVAVLVGATVWGSLYVRRAAILIGLAAAVVA